MKIRQNIEFGTTIALWSQCPDRFLSQGYKAQTSFEDKIKLASGISDIKGVDLYGDWDVNLKNIQEVKETLNKYKLKTFIVTADISSLPEFGRGSVTSPDKTARELAYKKIYEAVDMAEILGCNMINLWFGQDGYDYTFQSDYLWAWQAIIDAVKEIADYSKDKNIKIALEYKPREPRTHNYNASVGKTLFIIEKVSRENVGVLVDTGHAYCAGENIAESISLCKLAGDKLLCVHVNDNYKVWDDDMMVGSVHPFEMLEFLYWLEKLDYDGPIILDMFPYREDPFGAADESIKFIKKLRESLSRIDEDKIIKILSSQDSVESMKMLRESVIK